MQVYAAIKFLFQFRQPLNYANLKHYIHNKTKVIVKDFHENPTLTARLKPDDFCTGFIYSGKDAPCIFIDEMQNETAKTEVLLHEFCHFLKHSYSSSYQKQPRRANELEAEVFVYYVMKYHRLFIPLFQFLFHLIFLSGWILFLIQR